MFVLEKRKAAAIGVLCLALKSKQKKKKKYWSKECFIKRETGSHMPFIREILENNTDDLKYSLHMSNDIFNELLLLVTPLIKRADTSMRKAITPEQRLTATLRYLATGTSFEELKFSTAISPQALGNIIPETCRAIWHVLKDEYMKFPSTPEEWLSVARDFENGWNFPNCGGALDGKHVRINAPPKSGTFFYNYKGYYSVILMALVNANYEFLMVDVGKNGRMSDRGVFQTTAFYEKLVKNSLNLPCYPETSADMNFVFVADDTIALHSHILKPYPQRNLSLEKRIFNYRISRPRRTVENAFGIMSSRFRIFHTAINLKPEKLDDVIIACCVLHNFLQRKNKDDYSPSAMIDSEDIKSGSIIPGEWRQEPTALIPLQKSHHSNTPTDAKYNRDKYAEYFSGPGALPWQNEMI